MQRRPGTGSQKEITAGCPAAEQVAGQKRVTGKGQSRKLKKKNRKSFNTAIKADAVARSWIRKDIKKWAVMNVLQPVSDVL